MVDVCDAKSALSFKTLCKVKMTIERQSYIFVCILLKYTWLFGVFIQMT